MKVKKFTGPTMAAAVDAMKRDLGNDAIVLRTSRVPQGGLFSFLGKTQFEVTGAVDDPPRARHSQPAADGAKEGFDETLRHLRSISDRFETRRENATASRRTASEAAGVEVLRSELDELKNAVRGISDHLKHARMPALPDTLREAYVRLCEQDVAGELAAEIVQSVYAHLTPDRMSERRTVDEMVRARLASLVPRVPPEGRRRRKSTVVALVGPTGVGKTTTLAKLAALAKLVRRQDVGLISADTYRIGAIEQLRTFAAIADIPMAVAYKPADVTSALRTFRNKDVVFIDTVGKSQRATADLRSLGRLLSAADPDEIHLVLNAATGSTTALDIAGRFSALRPNRLILSKLDEAVSFGPMLDVLRKHRIPVSFATTGQTVPDDVQPVDPAWLASRLYQGGLAHA
jgi:flagellar biosynthesis protein FlhF